MKHEVEAILGKILDVAYLETADLKCYVVEIKTYCFLNLYFDNNEVCFEIRLDFDQNKGLVLILNSEKITENISFMNLMDIILKSKVKWDFDSHRTYLQTICVRLGNGVRFYYSFGDKDMGDFGLFLITTILEPHRLTNVGIK